MRCSPSGRSWMRFWNGSRLRVRGPRLPVRNGLFARYSHTQKPMATPTRTTLVSSSRAEGAAISTSRAVTTGSMLYPLTSGPAECADAEGHEEDDADGQHHGA